MNSATSALDITAVSPASLSNRDFEKLNEVTQDMWAYWIWELVQCGTCGVMHSKSDVFGHLSKDVYERTVASIMRTLDMQQISCPDCGWETKFIYGDSNVENIKERLLDSEDSFLVICRDGDGDIVGYMDGYVDSLDTIFRRELEYHYSEVWYSVVASRVDQVLGYIPPRMISFSSMGLTERHMSFFTIFTMLRTFFHSIPEKYARMTGITELDRKNNLYTIYQTIGSQSLWIADSPELGNQIVNTGKEYQSDLVVFRDPVRQSIQKFSAGVRSFLKMTRTRTSEVGTAKPTETGVSHENTGVIVQKSTSLTV